LRPSAECDDHPVVAKKPTGKTHRRKSRRRLVTPDNRSGAGSVRLDTGMSRHGNELPTSARAVTGRRVDDVMDVSAPVSPGSHGDTRARETARVNGDRDVSVNWQDVAIDCDANWPSAAWSRTSDCDVTAEVDQRTHSGSSGDLTSRPISNQSLRGRTEIQQHARGHAKGAGSSIKADAPPARNGTNGRRLEDSTVPYFVEVAVVAKRDERGTDGRIDGAASRLRNAEGYLDGLG
jgi:hypothetical protein